MKYLYPTVSRRDLFCTGCKFLFSVYVVSKRNHCPKCAEYLDVEKYNFRKHGSFKALYREWKKKDRELLSQLLKEPLTWNEIAKRLGRKPSAVRQEARRLGLKKEIYVKRGRRPKGE